MTFRVVLSLARDEHAVPSIGAIYISNKYGHSADMGDNHRSTS